MAKAEPVVKIPVYGLYEYNYHHHWQCAAEMCGGEHFGICVQRMSTNDEIISFHM